MRYTFAALFYLIFLICCPVCSPSTALPLSASLTLADIINCPRDSRTPHKIKLLSLHFGVSAKYCLLRVY